MAKGVLADELSNYPYIACVTGVSVGFSAGSRSFLPFCAQKLGRGEKFSARPKSEKCFKRAENPTETLTIQTLLLYVTLKAVAFKCEVFDMKIIFISDANKTHFPMKGFTLGLALKVRVFATRKWSLCETDTQPAGEADSI